MGKRVVLCLFLLCQTTFANTNSGELLLNCLKKEQTQKPQIYRDENGTVACVNYGEGKAIQYFYNDTKEEITVENRNYLPRALVAKKFFGFEYIWNLPDHDVLLLPDDDFFTTGLLQEELMRLNKTKKLQDLLNEYFKTQENVSQFLDQLITNYFSKNAQKIPPKLSEKSISEKLNLLTFALEHGGGVFSQDLSADNERKIRRELIAKTKREISLRECSPSTYYMLDTVLNQKVISQTADSRLRNFASISTIDNKISIDVSSVLFDEHSTDSIEETYGEIEEPTIDDLIQKANKKNHKSVIFEQYPNLSTLTWVMVRELGAAQIFRVLDAFGAKYHVTDLRQMLASTLLNPKEFPTIPDDLRRKIKDEVVDPTEQILDQAPEDYMIDAIPCIL